MSFAPSVLLVASAAALTCLSSETLRLDDNGRAVSGKFTVADREGDQLGVLLRADKKFFDAAAHVVFTLTEKAVRAEFVCPIAAGTALQESETAWNGDEVEFFVRPSWEKTEYFQYCANVGGAMASFRYSAPGAETSGWTSGARCRVKKEAGAFRITIAVPRRELFAEMPAKSFGVNFFRGGPTAGGRSYWLKDSEDLTDVDSFGEALPVGAVSHFAQADDRLPPSAHPGHPLLLYRAEDPDGNDLYPKRDAKPIEVLRFRTPRGSRQFVSVAVQNRRDEWYLGQVKVFDGDDVGNRFFRSLTNGVSRRISLSRGFPVYTRLKKPDYDVVEPLPMGTVLRLAPGEVAPLYFELDARGAPSGRHRCVLAVKGSASSYPLVKIPVEVEIADMDVADVAFDKNAYTRMLAWGHEGASSRMLADRGYNMIQPEALPYPYRRSDGSFSPQDYRRFDREIDMMVAGGMAVEKIKLLVSLGLNVSWMNPRTENGRDIRLFTDEWKAAVKNRLDGLLSHVREKYGIGRDRVIWYVVDEPFGDIDDPERKSRMYIAYQGAKFLKATYPDVLTMTDPLPKFLTSREAESVIPRLRQVYDIFQLYRPGITPAVRDLVERQRFRELWTYMIVGRGTAPAVYRRATWQNLRDGYREVSPFWHLEEAAGGDAFDPGDSDRPGRFEDYASVYADYNLGTYLLSRRQLAYEQGCEDARLILFARRAFADRKDRLSRLEELVRVAADKGSTSAMAEAREKILDLFGGAGGGK